VLLLELQPFPDARWGTYRAIAECGGQVRKGEVGTHIVLWKPVPKTKANVDDEPGSYLLMRDYVVFNATQADGLPALDVEEREFTPVESAQQIVDGYVWVESSGNSGPRLAYGGSRASYSMWEDSVQMPVPEAFESDAAFYSTLFHELIHSSGHEKRLARLEPALFGTDPYAKEELVAEIGASFLTGIAGMEDAGGEQSAAYVANWLGRLRDDRKLVVQAAAAAQKAVDVVLGTTFADESEKEVVAKA
jgi:antirestriction protein ArdC